MRETKTYRFGSCARVGMKFLPREPSSSCQPSIKEATVFQCVCDGMWKTERHFWIVAPHSPTRRLGEIRCHRQVIDSGGDDEHSPNRATMESFIFLRDRKD